MTNLSRKPRDIDNFYTTTEACDILIEQYFGQKNHPKEIIEFAAASLQERKGAEGRGGMSPVLEPSIDRPIEDPLKAVHRSLSKEQIGRLVKWTWENYPQTEKHIVAILPSYVNISKPAHYLSM
jgi:hypothetical protein